MLVKNAIRPALCIGALFLAHALFPLAFAQTTVAVFHANGAFAGAGNCSEVMCLWLAVSRGAEQGQPQTFLYYDVITRDSPDSPLINDLQGYGKIPNTAFKVSQSSASVSINTGSLPGFTNNLCTFNDLSGEQSCVAGSGGEVMATWTAQPWMYANHSTGTWTESRIAYRYTTAGTQDFVAATADFTVLGISRSQAEASLGRSSNTSITVQKK